ncbi:hypothetical protein BIV57_04800 [Mangrovactinospora gilvigrisea]|uniref:Plasmid stabilization protein n=1 Tax=Mangrovactinospora gilvigrisea TaxID=1428644 RepID=A0A1J7CAN3_9ACTN|nr:hypothetical protein [Mangrovactinospora gilvigrisea]OIV38576.1 hypothetical protein BIV57_04800 [Mangrovactinospora gilvigrisea]
MSWRVVFTTETASEREKMPPERRELLDKGLARLAKDPLNDRATQPYRLGGDDTRLRLANVAPGLLITYAAHEGVLIVVVLRIIDETFLVDE